MDGNKLQVNYPAIDDGALLVEVLDENGSAIQSKEDCVGLKKRGSSC
ncbi:hypothetical protein [Pleomorphovibrio marinus]|nr:hypothetical protein [Pleomorphovibrio marinus]